MVNAVVLVEEIQEEHQLTDKQGNAKKFKKVIVGDDTGSIVATFWGEDIEKISFRPGDVVMMSAMLVKDYQGKSLNCTRSSEIAFDIPNTREYQEVLAFKREGAVRGQNISSMQQEQPELKMNLQTISQIISSQSQVMETEDDRVQQYSAFVGYLIKVPPQVIYLSCPQDSCKKKVEDSQGHQTACIKCGHLYTHPKPRFFARVKFADESGEIDVSCSGETMCRELLGKSEQEVHDMSTKDQIAFVNFLRNCLFAEMKVKLVGKLNTYNDARGVKYDAKQVKSVKDSLGFFGKQLLNLVEQEEAK